jgi:hypothetical protein
MAVNKAKSEGFNPLAQIGKAFNEAGKALDKMLKGAPANAAKPPASKRSADKKGDKSSVVAGKRPGGVDGKKNAAVAPQPRMCKPSDAAKYVPKAGPLIGSDGTGKTKVEVIHKFEYDSVGRSLKADNGFMGTGLGKKRDSTFQMVQNQRTVKDAKTGKEKTTWEVHMQPTGEGRKNANVHMFSSNRKVKASDFNANDPANKNIRSKMADGFKRLNEDSNRLPEAPKAVAPKQPTNRWWIDQQARNVAGGLNSAGTSIVSMVGSLPENAVKVGSSIGNTSRSTANVLTGGRVGKTAFNPITTDKNSRYYDAPTNVESGLRGAQKANDKSMGANPDSIVYKTVDTLAPLVLTRGKGKGAGKPGGQKLLKPANPQQQLMPAKGDPVNFGKGTTPTAATPGNAGVKPTPSTPQHGNAGMKPTRVLPDKPVKVVRSSETPIKPVSKEIRQQYKNITAQSMPNGKVKLTQNGRPMSLNDVTAAVKSGHMNKAQLRSAGFSEKVADGILKQAGKGGAAANGAALVKPQPSAAGGSSKPSVKPDSAPKQLSAANAPKQLAPATGSQTPVQLGGSKPSSSGGGKPINTAPSGSGGGSSTQPRASSSSPQRSTNKPGTTYAELPVNKPLDLNTGPLPSTSAPIVRVQPGGKPVQSTKPKPIVESQPARSATPTTTKTPSLDKATQAKVDAANRMQSNPYQPGESINDARQRMGPAFNQKDYNAGSTTPRMSQDPPELSGQTVPQRARTPEQNRTPGLDFAERPTPQPLNISQGQPPSSTSRASATPPQNPSTTNNEASQTRSSNTPANNVTTSDVPPGGVPPIGRGRATGGRGDQPVPGPRLLTPLERASGELSNAMEQNVNPALRNITNGIANGTIPMDRNPVDVPNVVTKVRIIDSLMRSGVEPAKASKAAQDVITIARGLDVNPNQLANELINAKRSSDQQLATFNPQNPLLVDGSKPETLARGTNYFTNLFSQGVPVPAQNVPFEFDGQRYDVQRKPGLQTTAMNSDIDGPFAASYGMQGIDATFIDVNGRPNRVHIQTPIELPGTPIRISAPVGYNQPTAVVDVEVTTNNQTGIRTYGFPITEQQQRLINNRDPEKKAELNYVEGLSARLFPPTSVEFWQNVSKQNGRGGEYPGGVKSPAIVFNTFGSMGQRAFDNSAELVTSLARSLKPGSVPANIPPGLFSTPNLTVYSGGSAVTTNGVSRPFGLDPTQEQAMREVANKLPELVTRYSRKYDLSKEATDAWQSSIFANPDIPSVIIPSRTIMEFAGRKNSTHPGKTFADLQNEIERDMTNLVNEKNMAGYVYIHHTPSNPGDTLAAMADEPSQRNKYTTEWQFSMKGGKAMPVLDSVSNDLKTNFNIDLKRELEQAGYSYGAIRELPLNETITFLSNFTRSRIETIAGGKPVTPNVIVPVDTYYEGGGSDGSLVRSAGGLYTPSKTRVVQVDTAGGKPSTGRPPVFKLESDANGNLILRPGSTSGDQPVNPNGPNGALAPTVYVRSAADMGEMFNQAYKNQSPLSEAEVNRVRNRP